MQHDNNAASLERVRDYRAIDVELSVMEKPGNAEIVEQPAVPAEDHHHDDPKAPKTSVQRALHAVGWFCKDQWFLLAMSVVIIIASQVQVPLSQQTTKQVVVSYLSVSIIFFTAGCTLSTDVLIANYAKWKHHLFIQGQCFLLVSALGFAVVSLTATSRFMDPWLLIGLIFNACQPTAMASNVLFTRQSHGNATLTVVETTIGNLLGPFVSPLLIQMYLSAGAWYSDVIPNQATGYAGLYRRVFMQFGLSIYLPMFIGQCFRRLFPKVVQKVFIDWRLVKFGSFAMLALLWQTFDHAFATGALSTSSRSSSTSLPPDTTKTSNIVYIVFVSVINYAIWLISSFVLSITVGRRWLTRPDIASVVMTAPAKTLALGMPLSFLMFERIGNLEEAKIQVPMVVFQVVQMGLASLSTLGFRRWVDRGVKKEENEGDRDGDEEKAARGSGDDNRDGMVQGRSDRSAIRREGIVPK
jgi:solute carrier family 10 (sodium/bile acid cotransporter), member 7